MTEEIERMHASGKEERLRVGAGLKDGATERKSLILWEWKRIVN